MADIVQFPDSSRAHEDAALWLARIDKGLTANERVALAAWLEENGVNRTALLELASLWDGLDVLAELSELFPLEPRAHRVPPLVSRRVLAVCAAAIAAAAVGLLVYERVTPTDAKVPETTARVELFATPIGGHATQQLADGSVLLLNTATELEVDLRAESRNVYLRRGEAHFTIAHDAARPFRVHVGNRVLEAVGTAFNVYLKSAGSVELTVTEGAVKVAASAAGSAGATGAGLSPRAAAATTVGEGELAILDALDYDPPRIMRLEVAGMDTRLAWQRGMLIFQGEPLPQMLDEVSRYTTTKFVLEGEQLRDLRVGGYFRADDIDGLLLSLRDSLEIEFERVGADRVVLRAASAAR